LCPQQQQQQEPTHHQPLAHGFAEFAATSANGNQLNVVAAVVVTKALHFVNFFW
jgi:hypothetical protein